MMVTNVAWKRDTTAELAAHGGIGSRAVYNLTVADDHTFFVGTTGGGTWVHNAGPCSLVANAISKGHAFDKHILNEGQWSGHGLRTRNQFGEFIDEVMTNASGSNVRSLGNGRTAYWDNSTGTVVIHNPNAGDLGTVFQPQNGINYFNNLG